MSTPICIRTHKVGLKVPKYVLMVLKKEEHFDEEGYLVLTGNALVGKAFIVNALEIPFEFPERPYSPNILNIRLTDRLWVFYQVHRGHVEGFYEKMALRMIMCRIDTLHKISGLSIKDSIDRVYDYYGLSIMEYDQATAEQNYKIYRGVIRKKNNTT